MARLNIAPTKSNLLMMKEQLTVSMNGYELLEEKREILVRELMHLVERVKLLEKDIDEAVAKAYLCQVTMPEHFHMEIDFVKHHVAYSKSFYPGAVLKDGKVVCFDTDDWYEILRFCHFVLSNA